MMSTQQQKQQPTTGRSSSSSLSGCIVFQSSLAKQLYDDRFPPTYVGVRRVRPSNRDVQNAIITIKSNSTTTSTTTADVIDIDNNLYVVIDEITGLERRMNTKEKKELRKERALERKRQRKQLLEEKQVQEQEEEEEEEAEEAVETAATEQIAEEEDEHLQQQEICINNNDNNNDGGGGGGNNQKQYYSLVPAAAMQKLDVNSSSADVQEEVQNEVADIRGDRECVPPVALCPAITRQAIIRGTLKISDNNYDQIHKLNVCIDDKLASKWAIQLRQHGLVPAENVRHNEQGLRPLPYMLKPEVWNRNRPPSNLVSPGLEQNTTNTTPETERNNKGSVKEEEEKEEEDVEQEATNTNDWSFCQIRPPLPRHNTNNNFDLDDDDDDDHEAVIQLLYEGSNNIHVSDGAKFGCDYLLYDGPRQDRHAFAGLRVISSIISSSGNSASSSSGGCKDDNDGNNDHSKTSSPQLPIPSAYDMVAYVRCLNTAGKLALVATVVRDQDNSHCNRRRVAIVDLALEKVINTTSSTRRRKASSTSNRTEKNKRLKRN